jgi:hypothetical protein
MYSQTRLSTFDAYRAYQKQAGQASQADRSASAASDDTYNYGFSSTDNSRGTSVVLSVNNSQDERQPQLAAPSAPDSRFSLMPTAQDASRLSVAPNGQEQRLSEFYDAYYRNSQMAPIQAVDAQRLVSRHSTIVEVETPLASPMFGKEMKHPQPLPVPGAAF